jgi:hypothetical protein
MRQTDWVLFSAFRARFTCFRIPLALAMFNQDASRSEVDVKAGMAFSRRCTLVRNQVQFFVRQGRYCLSNL